MQGNILTLVNTRPDSKNLFDSDFQVLSAPMLDISLLEYDVPNLSLYDGLIFTSSRAVEFFFDDGCFSKDIYAVGNKTTSVLKEKGYKNIINAKGNGKKLCKLISSKVKRGSKLLHVRGRNIAFDIAKELAESEIIIDSLIIYKSEMVSKIDDNILNAIKNRKVDFISFYSQRSGEAFVNLVGKYGIESYLSSIKCLCFSEMVLNSVSNLEWGCTHVCDNPEEEEMIKLVRELS